MRGPARPVVLVTGVGRAVGIGAACAVALDRIVLAAARELLNSDGGLHA